ncbi:MAG: hypothetical protein EOP42_02695 [Sphingobacteriaceae bacterium]|nr:MAG: hypothetical protein EOP42_02695 [Sphingobacteriaceae bacterium]
MNEVFLEIDTRKLLLASLKEHQLPLPAQIAEYTDRIIFYTEDDYCNYLKEMEKASTKFLAEYWLVKSKQLIEKNRYIVKVLTILNEAKAVKDAAVNSN